MPYADVQQLAEYKREWARKAYAANPERFRAKHRAWAKANREQLKEGDKRRAAKYRKVSPEKERVKAERYRKANPAKFAARCAQRYAAKRQRTPAWADHAAIQQVYEQAAALKKETGIPHEVDHFYPLQGRFVSGLHVHQNLRVVTRSVNRRKSNRHE